MFKLSSREDLLECFRPLDRTDVIIPEEFHFPLLVKNYLAWMEPSCARVYLIFSETISATSRPLGIAFRRDQSGNAPVGMCEWCHHVGHEVALLTATASSKRRVGVHLCKDLNCGTRLESKSRLLRKMADFARHEIF